MPADREKFPLPERMAFGGAFGEQLNNSVPGLSWLSWAGKYDLGFIRPPGARTDPRAAIANRTCSGCGATYRSELVVSCAHCHAARPAAWTRGGWRRSPSLSDVGPIR